MTLNLAWHRTKMLNIRRENPFASLQHEMNRSI